MIEAEIAEFVRFVNFVLGSRSGYTLYLFKKPTRLMLGNPTATRNGEIIMSNYELANDTVAAFPILAANSAGVLVPVPSGDTFTVVSSDPASLNAVIGTAGTPPVPAVLVNALVVASPGLSFTLSDSDNLTSVTQGIDIVADAKPTQLEVGAAVVVGSQAVPTAPGP